MQEEAARRAHRKADAAAKALRKQTPSGPGLCVEAQSGRRWGPCQSWLWRCAGAGGRAGHAPLGALRASQLLPPRPTPRRRAERLRASGRRHPSALGGEKALVDGR
ncbi:hypothetical protein R5R35_012476 [Gryllus longicercus]|uniref:Uncharacterized protein n=1 Tax=Gryllus longicercus TaxID=2509291 RepID=A0AAN9VLN0_9ORTH